MTMEERGRRWKRAAGLALVVGVGVVLAVVGASWVPRWGEISIGTRLLAVVMMGVGGCGVLGIAAVVALVVILRRMGRGLKRDARSLAASLRYMLRMGR